MSKRLLASMVAMLLVISVSCYSLTLSLQRHVQRNKGCGWIALPAASPSQPPVAQAQIKGSSFSLKVADNDQARRDGLAGVAEIPADGGMIFVYPEDEERGFWMVGCVTDMDIVFINSQGRVVSFCTMLKEPLREAGESEQQYQKRLQVYHSRGLTQYAIEVKAGTWSRLGLSVGDQLEIRNAVPK